jgi:hypothetical protein
MISLRNCVARALLAAVAFAAPRSHAQEFAAVVSPPRFEISVNPGERSRQVVEITNVSTQASRYTLRTADWSLAPDGGVSFSDELAPGSCRPWVAIERREVVVPGGGRIRFRFELEPPADAPAGECRFALLIEGDEQTVQTAGGLNVPVSGRIAVIVYAGVRGGAPDLQLVGAAVIDSNGRAMPALNVKNTGNAHGRLAGFLNGTDAKGRRLEFTPSTMPILPGESRAITLSASDGSNAVDDVAFPVTVSGVLEWGAAGRVEINQQFAR